MAAGPKLSFVLNLTQKFSRIWPAENPNFRFLERRFDWFILGWVCIIGAISFDNQEALQNKDMPEESAPMQQRGVLRDRV
jgi:hypothetical protein